MTSDNDKKTIAIRCAGPPPQTIIVQSAMQALLEAASLKRRGVQLRGFFSLSDNLELCYAELVLIAMDDPNYVPLRCERKLLC